jgi:hypothetical protein
MEKIQEIICIGGGLSIQKGINLGLKEKIKDKLVIATNYSYKHFPHTLLAFIDKEFYTPNYAKKEPDKYPDIYEELKKEPLIIGLEKNNGIKEFLLPNTIIIDCPKKELKEPYLTGIFALCIAETLEPKQIFLLGFDWDKRDPKTIPTGKDYNPNSNLDIHYYKKEIQHKGLGYVGFYENWNPNNLFKHFNDSKCKIFNVSPNSNILNFEKIDYTTFLSKIDSVIYDQEELRTYIKNKIINS